MSKTDGELVYFDSDAYQKLVIEDLELSEALMSIFDDDPVHVPPPTNYNVLWFNLIFLLVYFSLSAIKGIRR